MASYWQHCRDCGERIQLREMRQGQWVAFESYDRVHDCSGPKQQLHKTLSKSSSPSPSKAARTPPIVAPELLRLLSQQPYLHIRYRDLDGRVTERNVRVVSSNNESLVAFCELRGARRTFRLDGILAAHAMAESSGFSPPGMAPAAGQQGEGTSRTLMLVVVGLVLLWLLNRL